MLRKHAEESTRKRDEKHAPQYQLAADKILVLALLKDIASTGVYAATLVYDTEEDTLTGRTDDSAKIASYSRVTDALDAIKDDGTITRYSVTSSRDSRIFEIEW